MLPAIAHDCFHLAINCESAASITLLQRCKQMIIVNPLTPNDLQRRRAVNPLKIKIPSKNMREKPTNATIIHSVY
jgi:hypothetical protein